MSKELIASDIDDVLANNAKGFIEFSNREFGTALTLEDYTEHWLEMWQVDIEEVQRRANIFQESAVVSTYEHVKEGVFALDALRRRFDFVAVTSRHSSLEEPTRAWLESYYAGVFKEVYFAGIYEGPHHSEMHLGTKAEIFEKLEPDHVIDDQMKHCIAAANLGIDTILFGDYPWNQADDLPPRITRCKDWPAVEEYFDAQ